MAGPRRQRRRTSSRSACPGSTRTASTRSASQRIFPPDVPVIFNFHGYTAAIKQLLWERPDNRPLRRQRLPRGRLDDDALRHAGPQPDQPLPRRHPGGRGRRAGASRGRRARRGARAPLRAQDRRAPRLRRRSTASTRRRSPAGNGRRANAGPVLVFNAGSSSLKFALFEARQREGSRPRGRSNGRSPADAVSAILAKIPGKAIEAVGHRFVHGGTEFREATLVTPRVKDSIQRLSELAPLHNPPALAILEAAQRALPDVPHVAVFDTAFFADLPERAARLSPALGVA